MKLTRALTMVLMAGIAGIITVLTSCHRTNAPTSFATTMGFATAEFVFVNWDMEVIFAIVCIAPNSWAHGLRRVALPRATVQGRSNSPCP